MCTTQVSFGCFSLNMEQFYKKGAPCNGISHLQQINDPQPKQRANPIHTAHAPVCNEGYKADERIELHHIGPVRIALIYGDFPHSFSSHSKPWCTHTLLVQLQPPHDTQTHEKVQMKHFVIYCMQGVAPALLTLAMSHSPNGHCRPLNTTHWQQEALRARYLQPAFC